MPASILLADDDPKALALTADLVRAWPAAGEVVTAESPEAALAAAKSRKFRLALVDLNYDGSAMDGFTLLRELRALDPETELVVLSSVATFSSVQQAMRMGATDYLAKGFGRGELHHALDRAQERLRWRRLEARVARASASHGLVGESAPMRALRAFITRLAPNSAPVLITGETGTGKELVARAFHAQGNDPAGPFVAVNCAAVPSSTADAFFFGHERGAFTGADRARPGVFEDADGGTLFLDEVNSLPPDMQGRLLRVLEQREVRRLGSSRTTQVEFRLIAATNVSLEKLLTEGRFREDLFYRLNTLQIILPPLRDRLEDLESLASHLLPQRRIEPGLWELFRQHAWPGNVRELRNLLTAMDAMAEPGESLSIEHVPEHLLRAMVSDAPAPDDLESFNAAQGEREAEYLRRVYRSANGNVSRLARMLGADRSHLHQKLVRLGIHAAKR